MILKESSPVERCRDHIATERGLTIAVNLTTTDHPLFLWPKQAQRKSLAKRNAAKPFRRCDGEKGSAPSTAPSPFEKGPGLPKQKSKNVG